MSKILYNHITNSNTKTSRKAWHEALIDYFELMRTMEKKIDLIRASLCSEKNFSPKNLFEYIDKKNKKKISLNDLLIFLRENKITFKEQNLRKFIHNFDKDNDFCLDYNEILGIILPRKDKLLQKNLITLLQSNKNYKITEQIKKYFCDLLKEEMKLIEGCNKIVKEIQDYNGFTSYEAFLDIVNGDEIYINEKNLAEFLNKNNININEEDSQQLIFRLDKDNDGQISYEEFQSIFLIIHKSNKKETLNNISNDFININDENNYKNNSNDKFNNNFFDEDISPKRKDTNTSITKYTKKDINIDNNNDLSNHLNQFHNSNLFYDSLECSKNQDDNLDDGIFVKILEGNNLKANNNINKAIRKYHLDNYIKQKKNENSKVLEEKIKKVFQIPKKKQLYTVIDKNEEYKEKEKDLNYESPKFSYNKMSLYYDYSINSNNKKIFERNNSIKNIKTLNLNDQETDFITNNNNQISNNNKNNNSKIEGISNRNNIKNEKFKKIPFTSRKKKNEIKNNSIIIFNTNNNEINQEKNKKSTSYNKIKDKDFNDKQIINNNLFKNNYKDSTKNKNLSTDKNSNDNNFQKLKKHLKKETNLHDLISNSPFLEKNNKNIENKNNNIKKNKNISNMPNKNKKEKLLYDNDSYIKNQKYEFKKIDNNDNLENFDLYDLSQNSSKSTSLINNPTQTNIENNIDTKSFLFYNNNNNFSKMKNEMNNVEQKKISINTKNNMETKKNNENYIKLNDLNNDIIKNITKNANIDDLENKANQNIYQKDIIEIHNKLIELKKNISSYISDNNGNLNICPKQKYNKDKNINYSNIDKNSSEISLEKLNMKDIIIYTIYYIIF